LPWKPFRALSVRWAFFFLWRIYCQLIYPKYPKQLPTILADNAGYDSADLVSRLRAAHTEGKSSSGLDMYNGDVADMRQLGITESFKLKRQVLLSASEAAELILRVDDIIRCAPRARQQE
jgi:T-complex protein 1 subunit beta